MAKFLAKLAAYIARDPENNTNNILKIIIIVVIILIIISSSSLEMIGSFADGDEYINEDFDAKNQELYRNIERIYLQFEEEMQKDMDKREAEIIEENTEYVEVETVDEQGMTTTITEARCSVTVSKQFTPINFSYVLSYINHKHPVKDGDKYEFDDEEILGFFKEIAPLEEECNGSHYTLFTALKTPQSVAEMYFTEDDDRQMYVLSYDLYKDFLDFVDTGSADSDIADGNESSPGSHYTYITKEEEDKVLSNCDDDIGNQVVQFALSKLGYPYSQQHRDDGEHFDCSSLCFYAYKSAGISITYGGSNTAAALANYCSANGQTVTIDQLQPGDLIFYCCTPGNGRFMGIDHVAIYAGEGKIIDASCSKGYVVYRNIFWKDRIVLCGRPR